MAETAASLPRHEITYVALDNVHDGLPVRTLLHTALGLSRDGWWFSAEKVAEVLTEVENAAAILRRRCDHLAQIDAET